MLLSFPRSSNSSVCTGVPLVCCAARGCAPTRRLTTRPLGTAGMCAYVFALHRWLCLSLHRTGCRTPCDGRLAQSSGCCSLCHRKTGTGTPSSLSRRIHLWPEIGCHNACGDLLGQNAQCCWRQPHKTVECVVRVLLGTARGRQLSRLSCASQRRAMHRIHALSSTRGASSGRRCRALALQVGGSGIALPYGNKNANANAKYHDSNWSKSRFPVWMVRVVSSILGWLCDATACRAASCCALMSARPALVRSPTTAFGLHMYANSSRTSSGVSMLRTGVAAFCRCTLARLSSCPSRAIISGGMPSTGRSSARSRPLDQGSAAGGVGPLI